jgi:hypothetical protein
MGTLGNTNTSSSGGYSLASNGSCIFEINNNTGSSIYTTSISFYISNNTGYTTGVKSVIWGTDGSVVKVGNAVNIIDQGSSSIRYWLTSNITQTWINGTTYWVGVVSESGSAGVFVYKNTGTGGISKRDNTNSYSSPETFIQDHGFTDDSMCIYVTYSLTPPVSPGPAITVEGITPASAESVLWANITGIQ